MQRKSAFSRRLPDLVTEELVAVLSKKGASFEFKQLFDVVHERLKKRNAASGGEEMLRLRAYEKLQHLVSRNIVIKTAKSTKDLLPLPMRLRPKKHHIPLPQSSHLWRRHWSPYEFLTKSQQAQALGLRKLPIKYLNIVII